MKSPATDGYYVALAKNPAFWQASTGDHLDNLCEVVADALQDEERGDWPLRLLHAAVTVAFYDMLVAAYRWKDVVGRACSPGYRVRRAEELKESIVLLFRE